MTLGRDGDYELSDLASDRPRAFKRLSTLIEKLSSRGIKTVLTLDCRLADVEIWREIAERFADTTPVVGNDVSSKKVKLLRGRQQSCVEE